MSIGKRGSSVHILRVRTAGGDEVLVDIAGFPSTTVGWADAEKVAANLARELADGPHPWWGPRTAIGDLLETLGLLGADPLDCVVQVVNVSGCGGENGDGVLHEESVRKCAGEAAFEVAGA